MWIIILYKKYLHDILSISIKDNFMLKVILLSLVGAVVSMIFGSIWHSSKLFGKVHMDYHAKKALTFEEHQNKLNEPVSGIFKILFLQFVLSFITSFFLAIIMTGGYGHIINKYLFMFVGLVWISFTVPAVGADVLWSDVKGKIAFKKFLSDIIYNLATFVIIIYIFTLIL